MTVTQQCERKSTCTSQLLHDRSLIWLHKACRQYGECKAMEHFLTDLMTGIFWSRGDLLTSGKQRQLAVGKDTWNVAGVRNRSPGASDVQSFWQMFDWAWQVISVIRYYITHFRFCVFVLAFAIAWRHTEATLSATQTIWIKVVLRMAQKETLAAALPGGRAGREINMIQYASLKEFYCRNTSFYMGNYIWFIWFCINYFLQQYSILLCTAYSCYLFVSAFRFSGTSSVWATEVYDLPCAQLFWRAIICVWVYIAFVRVWNVLHQRSRIESFRTVSLRLLVWPYSFPGAAPGFKFQHETSCFWLIRWGHEVCVCIDPCNERGPTNDF